MTTAAATLATTDLAVDHALAQLSDSIRFLLDISPIDGDEVRSAFLAGRLTGDPAFTYRDLGTGPEVAAQMLAAIDVSGVEDATLGHLLRAKHRELELQLEMLRARDTPDFRQLSVELYGSVAPGLLAKAERLLARVPDGEVSSGDRVGAAEFLAMAQEEIDHYRAVHADIGMHAEIGDDVNGVLVEGATLLIAESASVARERAYALLQHEVGTHLVTQVNGAGQPVKVLASGLAGYERTQEGLAVLAEIGCGGLTLARLQTLAARVVTVHRMLQGATFVEAYDALTPSGVTREAAFATTMRIYRAGGLTKDAIYLRGLVDLLAHLASDGELDLLWLGKFALEDLPLVAELHARGVLGPARVLPRWLADTATAGRLAAAAAVEDLAGLFELTKETP